MISLTIRSRLVTDPGSIDPSSSRLTRQKSIIFVLSVLVLVLLIFLIALFIGNHLQLPFALYSAGDTTVKLTNPSFARRSLSTDLIPVGVASSEEHLNSLALSLKTQNREIVYPITEKDSVVDEIDIEDDKDSHKEDEVDVMSEPNEEEEEEENGNPSEKTILRGAGTVWTVDEERRLTNVKGFSPSTILRILPLPDFSSQSIIKWVKGHALFFVHVPKSGGKSFEYQWRQMTTPFQRLYVKGGARDGSRNQTEEKEQMKKIRLNSGTAPRLDLTFMQRERIVSIAKIENRKNFTDMFGSTFIGVGHADILIAEAYKYSQRKVEFVTMLRDPIDRIFSHYCYLLQNTGGGEVPLEINREELHKLSQHSAIFPSWVSYVAQTNDLLSTESFKKFVNMSAIDEFDNWHTRAYSGCLHTVIHEQPLLCSSSIKMLEEAKRQLERFLFVGLTQYYNLSMALLRYTMRDIGVRTSTGLIPAPAPIQSSERISLRKRRGAANTNSNADDSSPSAMVDNQNHNFGPDRLNIQFNVNHLKHRCVDVITQQGSKTYELRAFVSEIEYLDVQLYKYAEEIFVGRINAMREQKATEVTFDK